MRRALIAIALTACVTQHQFRGETAVDTATCRNVARDVTGSTWGGAWRAAYNDCMVSRGLVAIE